MPESLIIKVQQAGPAKPIGMYPGMEDRGEYMHGSEHGEEKMDYYSYIKDWMYDDAKQYALKLMNSFGKPYDYKKGHLEWMYAGGFDMLVVKDESIDHPYPKPHKDFMYSTIHMEVTSEQAAMLALPTESLIVDQLKNHVTARCMTLLKNGVTLGLAQEIVAGKVTGNRDKLRKEYTRRIIGNITPDWFKDPLAEKAKA